MKKLLLGNEAVARGLFESGCKIISSYPGTPSTEITEYASKYNEMYSEWAPNEKVALEVAIGASVAGARSFCAMKHVGLNVAADPLYTLSYTGVNGGLVIAVADDPGMHSSQNEQDSRHHAIASKIMMIEPADSEECLEYTKKAFELSENFDTPVILRLSTRISHSRSLTETKDREELNLKPYKKNAAKYVMMPAMARVRHEIIEKRNEKIKEWSETCEFNKIEYNDTKIGVICAGISYQYAKEALGENASYLKLGVVNPLPVDLIKEFASKVDKLYVIEQLDDIIETHCKKIGVKVTGKEIFTLLGEYSQSMIKKAILNEEESFKKLDEAIPVRPPVLCPGCPHRGVFYVLNKNKITVSGDIGCYTLGSLPPLSSLDTCFCMGASVSALHGFNKADSESYKKSVAIIGDSTFIHSGITGIIDIAYNKGNSTVIILDNSITGMTGHQQNPSTGYTITGDPTVAVNLEALIKAVGINRTVVVDPHDMSGFEKILKEELAVKEPSVIIARRPCALLKTVKHKPALKVKEEKCKSCNLCQKVGCPAISMKNKKAVIDFTQCVGCELCKKLCKFDAIN